MNFFFIETYKYDTPYNGYSSKPVKYRCPAVIANEYTGNRWTKYRSQHTTRINNSGCDASLFHRCPRCQQCVTRWKNHSFSHSHDDTKSNKKCWSTCYGMYSSFVCQYALMFFYSPYLTANGVINVNTVAVRTPNKRVYFPPIFADNIPPGICVLEFYNHKINICLSH